MKTILISVLLLVMNVHSTQLNAQNTDSTMIEEGFVELSMTLLENVRDGKSTKSITDKLARITIDELNSDLDTVSKNKAFWLNIYNAYIQILLMDKPELFKDRDSYFGYNFFSSPQVTIAGKKLSFDDIEHGIIRRSKIKLSLGYLDKWFPSDYEVKFRWEKVDPRVHFALNCGAKACPYIAIYDPERVEEQLDITTRQYLGKTTIYNAEQNTVKVNTLMSWFRADFGGKDGALEILKRYNIIPKDADPDLSFLEYDWTLELGNFKDI